MSEELTVSLLSLTADIVASHLTNNHVATSDVPGLIQSVHGALSGLGKPAEAPADELKPAVPIRSSVKPDYIVCLEDGEKLTMLKRYLARRYDMTPEQYRAKWNLPANYPMVAPNYTEKRRSLAKAIGLGRTKVEAPVEAKASPRRKLKPSFATALSTAKEHLASEA